MHLVVAAFRVVEFVLGIFNDWVHEITQRPNVLRLGNAVVHLFVVTRLEVTVLAHRTRESVLIAAPRGWQDEVDRVLVLDPVLADSLEAFEVDASQVNVHVVAAPLVDSNEIVVIDAVKGHRKAPAALGSAEDRAHELVATPRLERRVGDELPMLGRVAVYLA